MARAPSKAAVASADIVCEPRWTFEWWERSYRSTAWIDARTRCDEAPESRYAIGLPLTSRASAGKAARTFSSGKLAVAGVAIRPPPRPPA